jgi:hypothetical protein
MHVRRYFLMKVLALEKDRPGVSGTEFGPHLRAEAEAVCESCQSGTIREIYFRDGPDQAVIILEVESPLRLKRPWPSCRLSGSHGVRGHSSSPISGFLPPVREMMAWE